MTWKNFNALDIATAPPSKAGTPNPRSAACGHRELLKMTVEIVKANSQNKGCDRIRVCYGAHPFLESQAQALARKGKRPENLLSFE
jgi:hypothetical protein